MDEVCNILDIHRPRSNLAKYKFLHKRLYIPRLLRKEICALHNKRFSKQAVFTTFSLFLIVSDVWYISNKYWLPNKSVKSPYIPLLFRKKSNHKHALFNTFLLVLTVGELCNNSNKCQLLNKSENKLFFLHNRPNIHFLSQNFFATLRRRSF